MSNSKRFGAVILAVMLLLALSLSASAATGLSDQGGAVGQIEGILYSILQDGDDYSLFQLSASGGEMSRADTAQTLEDLLIGSDGNAYYLAGDGVSYDLRRIDAQGQGATLLEFETGVAIRNLSWYDGMLYCLVNNKLNIIDPANGDMDEVCPLALTEYVIIDDVIFYVSGDDIATYTREVSDGNMLVITAGKLYSMTATGSNSELLLDKGIMQLKAAGDYLYFHNGEDNYAMGSSDDMWLEGKLYRYNIQTGQLSSMNLDYDWDFFPTPRGVVVYTAQDVSLYPLTGGDGQVLAAPELYTTLTTFGDSVYVYEHSTGVLTQIPLDGSALSVLATGGISALGVDDGTLDPDDELSGDDFGDDLGDDDDDDDDDDGSISSSSGSSSSSSSSTATSSGYIFPNSSKKKLTRSQILKISKSNWGYARNEIYARHGYQFKNSKYKNYFSKKTWYKPGNFSTGKLNSIEWYNMDLIKSMEIEYGLLSGSTSSSGGGSGSGSGSDSGATNNSYVFSNSSKKKLTDSQLKGLSKTKLGIARNEILARHGYVFKTDYYKKYFNNQKWYKAGGYSSGDLNSVEWYNIKLIKKWEAKK
jgi:hypothetical protein